MCAPFCSVPLFDKLNTVPTYWGISTRHLCLPPCLLGIIFWEIFAMIQSISAKPPVSPGTDKTGQGGKSCCSLITDKELDSRWNNNLYYKDNILFTLICKISHSNEQYPVPWVHLPVIVLHVILYRMTCDRFISHSPTVALPPVLIAVRSVIPASNYRLFTSSTHHQGWYLSCTLERDTGLWHALIYRKHDSCETTPKAHYFARKQFWVVRVGCGVVPRAGVRPARKHSSASASLSKARSSSAD